VAASSKASSFYVGNLEIREELSMLLRLEDFSQQRRKSTFGV